MKKDRDKHRYGGGAADGTKLSEADSGKLVTLKIKNTFKKRARRTSEAKNPKYEV